MTKEVGEIISEMEENMSSPMRNLQGFVSAFFLIICETLISPKKHT